VTFQKNPAIFSYSCITELKKVIIPAKAKRFLNSAFSGYRIIVQTD
jgi:hypothetical protein